MRIFVNALPDGGVLSLPFLPSGQMINAQSATREHKQQYPKIYTQKLGFPKKFKSLNETVADKW